MFSVQLGSISANIQRFFLRSLKENKCIIYLFWARLRPCCRAGSSRVEASELLTAVASPARAQELRLSGSRVRAQELWPMGF